MPEEREGTARSDEVRARPITMSSEVAVYRELIVCFQHGQPCKHVGAPVWRTQARRVPGHRVAVYTDRIRKWDSVRATTTSEDVQTRLQCGTRPCTTNQDFSLRRDRAQSYPGHRRLYFAIHPLLQLLPRNNVLAM